MVIPADGSSNLSGPTICDNMKVIYFTDTYKPQINGVVTSIELFSDELRSLGHEVHIVCPKDGNVKEKFVMKLPSFNFKAYHGYKITRPSLKMLKLLKKIKKWGPDLIHIQTPATCGILGVAIAKKLKIPVVMTYHTMLSDYVRYLPGSKYDSIRKLNRKMINKYTRIFLKRANLIIAPSRETKKYLSSIGVKRQIKVLPTGIKVCKCKRKRPKKIRILHVGRLCKEKSIDILIKAFSELQKTIDSELIITSRGPAEKELKNLVKRLGLQNKVTFTGYVSESKMHSLYASSDLFVLASTTDTQGLVPLEAMLHTLPVIVANKGGIKDYVKHNVNGLQFKSNDIKDLKNKMEKLLKDNKLRKRLTKNAKQTVKELDIKRLTKRLLSFYQNTILNYSYKSLK